MAHSTVKSLIYSVDIDSEVLKQKLHCSLPRSAVMTNGIAENLPLNRMLGDYDIIHGTFLSAA